MARIFGMAHVEDVESTHYRAVVLKSRGWSESMIRELLGEPDARTQNPYAGRGKAAIRWYARSRVAAAEETEAFAAAHLNARSRSASSFAGAKRRAATLLGAISKIPITAPNRELDLVRSEAIESYKEAKRDEHGFGEVRRRSKSAFLDWITVNYIRHELTDYDALLESLKGKVGKYDAIDLVRERVLGLIADRYPDLSEECWRQIRRGNKRREWRDLFKALA